MSSSLSRHSTQSIGDTATSAITWRFKGELRVTAIVKATFAFANDGPMPRVAPQPIVEDEVHHARNPMRSISLAGDLAPYRKRADAIFTGSAYAPGGGPAESATARFGVASGERVVLDKKLAIQKRGGFKRIPLLYEHAVGGPVHAENPYGEEEGSEDRNVFDPADPARVAGFGPLARSMPARKRLLGGFAIPKLGPSPVEIPDTFDFDFFQAAPPDQQIGFLRGDEWILLENMHPAHASLRMHLPGARALARIHGLSVLGIPEGKPLAVSADALHVRGDEEICTVTWRGTFAVASEAALGSIRIVMGVELPGEPIVWPEVVEAVPSQGGVEVAAAGPDSVNQTLPISEQDIIVVSSPDVTLALDSAAGSADMTLPVASSVTKSPLAALPFRAPVAGAAAVIAASLERKPVTPSRGSAGETLPIPSEVAKAPRVDPLPFATTKSEAPSPAEEAAPAATLPSIAEASPKPIEASEEKPESPWAPPPPAPPKAPEPPKKKLPPRVDIGNKLYGTKKKG
ncbi:MAG: DUF2169 domain-containing protein [Minicystis sp.]